jgi:hypothetical protein
MDDAGAMVGVPRYAAQPNSAPAHLQTGHLAPLPLKCGCTAACRVPLAAPLRRPVLGPPPPAAGATPPPAPSPSPALPSAPRPSSTALRRSPWR